MNNRIAFLTVLLAMGAASASAKQLTQDEAISNLPEDLRPRMTRGLPSPMFIQKNSGLNVAYVYKLNDKGFVIAAADDIMPAVLGYSDTGKFDPDNIPPSLAFWLENYGEELRWAIANGQNAPVRVNSYDLSDVEPICRTKWDQGMPYNDFCPVINGVLSPTGCTATAVAQVVASHRYPERGWGANTYIPPSLGQSLTFDFGSTTFDWDNMLDSYSSGYTREEADAVATLMEGVGNLSLMDYGEYASGAWPYDSLWGLVNFMGYDRGGYKAEREFYPIGEWMALLHGELTEGRPIAYSGANFSAGHAFVVDGYKDGYFHLNWGWGGMSDGYFLITALDPTSQGIGGSSSGYNIYQDALIGVMPNKGNSQPTLILYAEGSLASTKTKYKRNERTSLKMRDGKFRGFTLEEVQVMTGLRLTPTEGGEPTFYPGSSQRFKDYYGSYSPSGFLNISVDASTLPTEGTYYVTPAFEHEGAVHDARFWVGHPSSMMMTCTPEQVTLTDIPVERELTVESMQVPEKIYVGKSCSIEASLSVKGEEYYGYVIPCLYDDAGNLQGYMMNYDNGQYTATYVLADVAEGRNDDILFKGSFRVDESTPLEGGTYILSLMDEDWNRLSGKETTTVTLIEPATGTCRYTVTASVAEEYPGSGTKADPYQVGDDLKISMKVKCTSGFLDCSIRYWGFYLDSEGQLDYYNSPGISNCEQDFLVNKGDTQEIMYDINVSNSEMDRIAAVRPYLYSNEGCDATDKYITNPVYFMRTSSGVEAIDYRHGSLYPNPAAGFTTVSSEDRMESIEIYNMTGALEKRIPAAGETSATLDLADIPSGHHIVLVKTENGCEAHRLIRR